MICKQCQHDMSSLAGVGKPRPQLLSRASLSALFCARCGSMVAPTDPVDAMLTKLFQLSRFGLGADDRPLLATNPRGR